MGKRRADVMALGGILIGALAGSAITLGIAEARQAGMHRYLDVQRNVEVDRHVACSIDVTAPLVVVRGSSTTPHVISIRGNTLITSDEGLAVQYRTALECESLGEAQRLAAEALREQFERIDVSWFDEVQRNVERARQQVERERDRMEVNREGLIERIEQMRLSETGERLELELKLESGLRAQLMELEAALEQEVECRKRKRRRRPC